VIEDVDGPWMDAFEADEEVDGRGKQGVGRVLGAHDDGVGAPQELELGEWVGDGDAADGEEAWAWCGGVDLDGQEADDDGVVVREVDGLHAVVGLGEGWVEELDLFVSEVGEVPERDRAAVVYATGDEGGAAEEMELAEAIDGRLGFEPAFGVLGIKVDRKHLCPNDGQPRTARGEGTYWADCIASTAELVGSELRTMPP
jgi:hypothetical protein